MRIILTILFVVLSISSTHSQLRMRYNIGSIGNMGDMERKYSGPYYIQGSECLWVANGVKTLFRTPRGSFLITCELQSELLYVLAFPNPATSVINVRAVYSTMPINTEHDVRIIDMNGEVRMNVKTSNIGLKIGIKIPIYMLPRGYYVIVISASKIIKSIQFMKN